MHLVDRQIGRARNQRTVDAVFRAAGFTYDGQEIVLADEDDQVRDLDDRLTRPLGWERVKAALIAEASR